MEGGGEMEDGCRSVGVWGGEGKLASFAPVIPEGLDVKKTPSGVSSRVCC